MNLNLEQVVELIHCWGRVAMIRLESQIFFWKLQIERNLMNWMSRSFGMSLLKNEPQEEEKVAASATHTTTAGNQSDSDKCLFISDKKYPPESL